MASDRVKTISTKLSETMRLLVAGLGITALPCTAGQAQSPAVPALVVKAVPGCFSSAVHFAGLIVPRAEAIVNLNVEGYQISEVLVAEGDAVTSGQVLARLTRLASGAPARAAGSRAEGGAGAQRPANMTLRAPVSGVISLCSAKIGEVAAAVPLPAPLGPEPLFRIIVGNELEVEGDVLSVHLPKLKIGQLAPIWLDNGRDLTGQVRTVFPEIDHRTQLGKVRLTVENDPAIRAGIFVRGTIDASHSCGVAIPRSAVTYRTEGTTVQVLRDTAVETRHVRVGFFSDTEIEVREGVKEGELVIASAGTSLHDGDQVKPVFADEFSQLKAQ
jgi:HlyD family secretion protein